MSQAPTPRGPLGQLLDDAKTASEQEWRDIEAGSGIPLATIQSWTSGRVAEPPLRGVLHLANYLGIPPQFLADRALEGYVPPLKARVTNGAGAELDPGDARSEVSDEVAVLGDARTVSPRPKRQRRGSKRRPES